MTVEPPTRNLTKAGLERKRDAERTRATILDAAIVEFTQNGYEGGRVDAIAKRAKINKRMLYHYFGGKDGLYLAVLEGRYVAIRSAETRLDLRHREPADGVRELVLFTWHYFLEHPEFLSILATENLQKARFLRRSDSVVQLNSPLIEELRLLLQRGAESGVFRKDADPVRLYISIASLGSFYLSNRWTLSTIFRRELFSNGEIEAWGNHIVDMVLSYLRP
jgi:AcrR family transcriptional regulator